ncbi:MAG: FtsW/RodA/SpoVE family cell cycle protein, partial [Mariprofundales bacterium]|nr:FtsW/RodA/SpoVE family cell cycle protein [Mariprofundales bacterium]
MTLWPKVDWWLMIFLLLLAAIGLLTLYSAIHQGNHSIWWRQLAFWGLGLTAMSLGTLVPLRIMGVLIWPVFIISLLLLALVPVMGDVQMGAQRWLNFGPLRLQPSELVKWTVMLMLAHWFASRSAGEARALWLPAVAVAIPVLLIAQQPDLGTALVVLMESMALLIISGFRWRWLLAIVAASPLLLWFAWHTMHSYQRRRVLTLLDPQ